MTTQHLQREITDVRSMVGRVVVLGVIQEVLPNNQYRVREQNLQQGTTHDVFPFSNKGTKERPVRRTDSGESTGLSDELRQRTATVSLPGGGTSEYVPMESLPLVVGDLVELATYGNTYYVIGAP